MQAFKLKFITKNSTPSRQKGPTISTILAGIHCIFCLLSSLCVPSLNLWVHEDYAYQGQICCFDSTISLFTSRTLYAVCPLFLSLSSRSFFLLYALIIDLSGLIHIRCPTHPLPLWNPCIMLCLSYFWCNFACLHYFTWEAFYMYKQYAMLWLCNMFLLLIF